MMVTVVESSIGPIVTNGTGEALGLIMPPSGEDKTQYLLSHPVIIHNRFNLWIGISPRL